MLDAGPSPSFALISDCIYPTCPCFHDNCFDHVQTLMTRSMSTYVCQSKRARKEPRSTVLLGFLKCSTDGSITGQDFQLCFDAFCSQNLGDWIWTHAQWTLNASSVSARDQSLPGFPPLRLKHKLRVNKIALLKQEEGESLGTRLGLVTCYTQSSSCTSVSYRMAPIRLQLFCIAMVTHGRVFSLNITCLLK